METNQKTTNVEVINENKINYQFIPVPLKLFYCCDMNCRSLLVSLVQLSTVFRTEKGWFFRTTDDLRHDSLLSENVLRASLDSLYKKNLISIIYNTHEGHFFRVNFEEFEKYENIEFDDCRNEVNRIDTEKYINSHYSPSYCSDSDKRKERSKKKLAKSEHLLAKSEHLLAVSEHNIDNIFNIDKSLNKNKILNKENDSLENTKEERKLNNGIESILNELFEDNNNNNKVVTVPATQGKELNNSNEDIYSNEIIENNLKDNSNEKELKQMVSASQNEETSTKDNSLIETYNNKMNTSTKENYNDDNNTKEVTVPATQGKELVNSNEDIINSEAVGSDLRVYSNGNKETIVNSAKVALIASNNTNIELNDNSNEEIYIKVNHLKKNIEVMDNNKEDNKVLPCKTSQSATREVQANFDSAAARPAASAVTYEDYKKAIGVCINQIIDMNNSDYNTVYDFDEYAKAPYLIIDSLQSIDYVMNNNKLRADVEECIKTLERLRTNFINKLNNKKETKQYF